MMINSPPLHSNPTNNKRLRFSLPRHKNDDLLINPTSEKFEDINNNHYQENNTINCNNTMKQEILVSNNNNNNNNNTTSNNINNNNENDKTLLTTTTTTTTTTVEFKVKTTKTSSRKRKSNAINDTNNDNINKEQANSKKKKPKRTIKSDEEDDSKSHIKKNSNTKTTDQSSSTDESSFGSCEPGTNVVLQGIVWNETDKGVLVVNITWRGKTYVGALLNTTEQNWAPPRYKSDVRSIKQNHNRDHQLTSTYESNERILRNGKRRASTTTVISNNTTSKIDLFKMPEIPPTKNDNRTKLSIVEDDINPIIDDKSHIKTISNPDDEVADTYSSRSISPTTSGTSTTSSSPSLLNNIENQSASLPIDLSNSKLNINIDQTTSTTIVQPYHINNDMLFSSSMSADYFSSLANTTNPLNLTSLNKLSVGTASSSPSSYHSIPTPIYVNSTSKSSH